MQKWGTRKGFTIVELLIVVVVIAILAAITIVAYNGIQNRAKESAVQSSASQVGKKIASHFYTNNDTYPIQANFSAVTGVSNSADLTYDYLVTADSKSYCASAANSNVTIPAYASTPTSGGTVKGRCVMNMEPNPSSETTVINSAGGGGATRTISSAQKFSGANSTKFVWVSANSGLQSTTITVTPSTTYTVSLYVYAESGTLPVFMIAAADYGTNSQPLSGTAATGSWQRLSQTYTTNSTQTTMRTWTTVSSASTFYVDAIMITPLSSGLPAYADGSTNNWVWNGTPNNSTSFGPSIVQ